MQRNSPALLYVRCHFSDPEYIVRLRANCSDDDVSCVALPYAFSHEYDADKFTRSR